MGWLEVINTFYDIEIEHRRGRKRGNADTLSRIPCTQGGIDSESKAENQVRTKLKLEKSYLKEVHTKNKDIMFVIP